MFATGRGAMARVSIRRVQRRQGALYKTIWGRVHRRIVDTALAQGDECPSDPDRLGIGWQTQETSQLKARVDAVPVTQLLGA